MRSPSGYNKTGKCPHWTHSGNNMGCEVPGFSQWVEHTHNFTISFQMSTFVKMMDVVDAAIYERAQTLDPTPTVVIANTGIWGCQSPGMTRKTWVCGHEDVPDLRAFVRRWGPSGATSAPRSLRRALLIPQVNPGSLYRCGKRT